MASVCLKKGHKISLEKSAGAPITTVTMGLGWDVATSGGGFFKKLLSSDSIDLDASCLTFDANNKVVDTIWFQKLKNSDRTIVHTGDNLTGDGDGDDECIEVQLDKLSDNVQQVVFVVNSFTGQSFERISNAFCRVFDTKTKNEIAMFNLSECQGTHNAMVMAKFYRHKGEWKMSALGERCSGRTWKDIMPTIEKVL